jgi:hypothetical protein
MNDLEIPAPDATDDDDVVVALETARTELERGSREDAAKWLHRAVAAASHQGRAERTAILRAALATFGEGQFAPRGDEEVALSDVDDFSDETIVDDAPQLPPQVAARPAAAPAVTKIATSPTPVAQPPRPSKGPPTYGAVRVSVRRALGGKWEVRPLGERESAPAGEEEALLVPLRPGAKFV